MVLSGKRGRVKGGGKGEGCVWGKKAELRVEGRGLRVGTRVMVGIGGGLRMGKRGG